MIIGGVQFEIISVILKWIPTSAQRKLDLESHVDHMQLDPFRNRTIEARVWCIAPADSGTGNAFIYHIKYAKRCHEIIRAYSHNKGICKQSTVYFTSFMYLKFNSRRLNQ